MENKYIFETLVKNLHEEACSLVPNSIENLYLTSFKSNDMLTIEENMATAEEIERIGKTNEFLEEGAKWSKGRAVNPVIMTDISDDGLIDVNLLFTVK